MSLFKIPKFSLTEFRSAIFGYPDLLPWAALVDNGVVLTKSGGLIAGWEYRGPDLDSATSEELLGMSARVNRALSLGDGWVIHCDAVRAPVPGYAPEGDFEDRTTKLIDDWRRRSHTQERAGFASRYILTVTWWPMPDSANKAAALFIEGRSEGTAQRNLERFNDSVREIEGRLDSLLRIRRMTDVRDERTGAIRSELLGHLAQCATFTERATPLLLPEVPMYLDALIGHENLVTGFTPRIGRRSVAAISLTGMPAYSSPGILDFLSRLPVAYRWSNRFIYIDATQADKVIGKYRSQWSQKRKSMMNLMRENSGGTATHVNIDADRMVDDAVQAMAEASSGQVSFGYYSSTILIASENQTQLDEIAREIVRVIENKGFKARVEDVNAVEAILGSMPGNTSANVRRPLIHTLNLAHLLPLTALWAGPDKHPCPFYPPNSPPLLYAKTDGFTPFRLCLHDGDLGHTAILGPTSTGKSTLIGTLVAQHFRYARAQVFAFDKGYSLLPLVWASGGQHYDIAGGDESLAFCPLGQIDQPSERQWAAEWIESLVELQGIHVTPGHRKEIFRAIEQVGRDTDSMSQRTLTNFLVALQDNTLREALHPYTLRGMAGNLLDAETDSLADDAFQVFEMEHLMNKGDKLVLPVLSYLFHRLEQRFKGQPTLLVLDEAWIMLSHPVFKEKIREWLKVLRKSNVAVVFATQSLTDLSRSGIADVIFESCPTKVLLPNLEAQTENIRPLYQSMGLNLRQIEILATATPKRQYYVMQPDGRRLFELGLSGPELAFVGASGKEDIARVRELRARMGNAWPAQWLRERGQPEAAAQWESY
ncbi:MAG: hypothetical protein RLY95_11 [Pseudomonadota bacterium]|jgi:type IV secretion system protein VirB4